MSSNNQSDLFYGDIVDVPIEVDTMKFVTARAQEIAAISQDLDDPKKGNLIFQRLPRHMRRRVMGHNAKRMPRNLQDAYTQQLLKSSGGSVSKRKTPSRKHRRRPSNLLEEYNRRQKSNVWLETHIWHAKRFHMTERWGYRVAEHPNDRSYRACYRATANHCLLQDISFLCCIEVTGPVDTLLSELSKHTNTSSGLTFGAQSVMSGSREGEVMFYESNMYPWQPVGTVSFFWKPLDSNSKDTDVRTLWIWVHPSFQKQVVEALANTFGLLQVPSDESTQCVEDCKRKCDISLPKSSVKKMKIENGEPKKVEEIKLATRNVPFERTPKYSSACGKVTMVLLKDTMNRFRLTGPLSQAVLEEALELVSSKNNKTCLIDGADSTQLTSYRESNPEGRSDHHHFWLSAKGAMSPAQMPPKIILYLTVKDPRLCIPDKRTKAVPNTQDLRGNANILTSPPSRYVSPIWSSSVRDIVTKSKITTSEMNTMRSKFLVPGLLRTVECNEVSGLDDAVDSKIPLILIQRPGSQEPASKRLGFGCGWDVVLPAGWAMPFWLAFIFRCARSSGLREAASHELEAGQCEFLSPDTLAGKEESLIKGKKLREAYFRLPPNKRPNFIKLGIACPFYCDWISLIRDWIVSQEVLNASQNQSETVSSVEPVLSFFVLRDQKILQEINEILKLAWTSLKRKSDGKVKDECLQDIFLKLPTFSNQEFSLLPIRVEALQKGVTDDMSIVCVPSTQDVEDLRHHCIEKSFVEPACPDNDHELRQKLRKDHKMLLLRLRRQRVRSKKRQERESEGPVQRQSKSSPTNDLVISYNKKMESLWLPNTDNVGSVKNSCSRVTAGFVTRGNFSFTEARGCGTGYITYLSLRSLIQAWLGGSSSTFGPLCTKSKGFIVLVRSPNNLQYRPAQLSVILK